MTEICTTAEGQRMPIIFKSFLSKGFEWFDAWQLKQINMWVKYITQWLFVIHCEISAENIRFILPQ